MCRWLACRGLDLTLRNRNGHSAVHKAAVKGNAAACAWLLGEGGLGRDHLRPDGDGNTPSRMARAEGFAELAEWLVAREASSATCEPVARGREPTPGTGGAMSRTRDSTRDDA